MKSPNKHLGPVPGKIVVSSLAGLAAAAITGFVLIYPQHSSSTRPANSPSGVEAVSKLHNTVEITREEALARFGEEAQRKRALEESVQTQSPGAAQLVFLDENGNRVSGRIQDIPNAPTQAAPRGPVVTWPGANGGTVADTRHIRSYTYVTLDADRQLDKNYVTGTREDAKEALKNKLQNESKTAIQTDGPESEVQ